MSELPKVIAVTPASAPFTLNVTWGDKTRSKVDLTGLVARSRHFRVFLSDTIAFRDVRPTEFGSGIEWKNGLDYSAATLKVLADEQKVMTGRDLLRFESDYGLNTEEMARVFKVTPRSIANWRNDKVLPVSIAIALRAFRRDPTAFVAHYKPVTIKPRGRPKTSKVG